MIDPILWFTKMHAPLKESKQAMRRFTRTLMKGHEDDYRGTLTSTDRKQQIVLDKYYQIRDTMNYRQATESIGTVIVGGFDTTGTALSIILLLLAMNPNEQDKVFQELLSISYPDDDKLAEKDLNEMKLMDMAMKESMRLIPVTLGLGRTVGNDIKLSKLATVGKVIRK